LSAISRGCRIGKIRLKSNGAEIYKLPDAAAQRSLAAFDSFEGAISFTKRNYEDELNGYCLVTWTRDGQHSCHFSTGESEISGNNLAEFVKGAITREMGKCDARVVIRDEFSIG
jgi:hypothetical protein